MSKREAKVILPLFDNSGQSVQQAHEAMRIRLLAAFGGCSWLPISGAWADEKGAIYQDESLSYNVAYEPCDMLDEKLSDIALSAGQMAGQMAIYVQKASGIVDILDCAPRRLAA